MFKILIYILESILLFNVCHIFAKKDTELLFVQILWRHGDRAPFALYPNDPNPETLWNEGLGQLTMLGRKQHYALGKYLRRMYEDFTTSSPNEVKVISSDFDRCMKSAGANLASFFAPSAEWKFDNELNWQPISISYIPEAEDKYLETESYCPRSDVEQKRVWNSPDGQASIARYKEMFDYLTMHSGKIITNWTTASDFHDTVFVERKYNLVIPSWVDPYWNELKHVADLSFYWSFNSPLLHRLRAGPLLGRIIEMMNSKLAGDIPLQKFQIYSAHDTNVAVILDAFNLYNMRQPPYCATLLFELHEIEDGVKAVRLLYLNSSNPETQIEEPNLLILEGCTEFCPLDHFVNLTKSLIPEDWEQECQLDKTFVEKLTGKNVAIGLFFAMMAVIILALSIYSMWRLYFRDRHKYSYHLMQMH